jgi:hypothetical protein
MLCKLESLFVFLLLLLFLCTSKMVSRASSAPITFQITQINKFHHRQAMGDGPVHPTNIILIEFSLRKLWWRWGPHGLLWIPNWRLTILFPSRVIRSRTILQNLRTTVQAFSKECCLGSLCACWKSPNVSQRPPWYIVGAEAAKFGSAHV